MSARMHVYAPAFVLAMAPLVVAGQEAPDRERWEAEGRVPESAAPSPLRAEPRRARGFSIDLLLVPDSAGDRVMAFDPTTGNLVDANWVPSDPPHLQTPKAALADPGHATLFVVDQISDVVQWYAGVGGMYLGIHAPPGGPNTAILDNATCLADRPNSNNHLLVCVTGGANQDSIAEFDIAGAYVGNFIANGAGGLDGPFDVLFRTSDVLVSSINTDQILRYDLAGASMGVFAAIDNFPEQIAEAANGNVLVANFGGTEEGIVEYTAAGAFVGRYNPPGLGSYRGVYELPNLNLLVSSGAGVHEITRAGALVDTKIATTGAQYIELVQDLTPVELQAFTVE